jgi:hypothetical protein
MISSDRDLIEGSEPDPLYGYAITPFNVDSVPPWNTLREGLPHSNKRGQLALFTFPLDSVHGCLKPPSMSDDGMAVDVLLCSPAPSVASFHQNGMFRGLPWAPRLLDHTLIIWVEGANFINGWRAWSSSPIVAHVIIVVVFYTESQARLLVGPRITGAPRVAPCEGTRLTKEAKCWFYVEWSFFFAI